MKLTIENKTENLAMNRIDLNGKIDFDVATPSNEELTLELAKKTGVDKENVVVKQIKTLFSKQTANFKAVAYKTIESKNKYEVMTKHLKKIEEKQKKEAAEKKQADEEAKLKAQEEAKAAKEAKEQAAKTPAETTEPASEEKSE
ncbi:hypothetical protein HOC01_00115 [archaeon]|jgi:ribosomal protein S24E|nr:hypothetical protein [archaeon]MBT6698755.1 hypothetical protein [archaeon]